MSSQSEKLDQARRLFRLFHGRDPIGQELSIIDPPKEPEVILEVGPMVQLRYQAKGNRNFFKHSFERPLAKVYVSYDGLQIFTIGGGYRFTPRGFVR